MKTHSAAWKRTLFCEVLHMHVLDWTGHRLLVCRLTLTLQTYIMGGKTSWCRSEFLSRMSSSFIQRCNWGRDPAVTYWPTTWVGVGRVVSITLQMVSGAILTHRCGHSFSWNGCVAFPHSIWFWQEHKLGQHPDAKTGRCARDALLNCTPFAPNWPCRYCLSLLFLVIL